MRLSAGLSWCILLASAAFAQPALPPVDHRPLLVLEETTEPVRGYASSRTCQGCHEEQYDSWHRTYHRTMTQVVTTKTVLGDFENVTLALDDREYVLERRGEQFWVELPLPEQQWKRVERQVVMSTGSHHYQLYWYSTGLGREVAMMPFGWLKSEQRWVPRRSLFMAPPGTGEEKLTWNIHCVGCHSTDGQPGYTAEPAGEGPDTRVAEMGIACEACHGPGLAHVKAREAGEVESVPMVHPKKLSGKLSAQVCGQCHSVNVPEMVEDWVDWLLDGPDFRPGTELSESRFLIHPENATESTFVQALLKKNDNLLNQWFWPDGQVRVTGREYTALKESPCFESDKFACVSCHSQHYGEPDDLMPEGMRDDQGCIQCHDFDEEAITAHTYHPVESEGSRCYNCHMPNTSYGLIKATRVHTVASPSVEETLAAGRPNACNLCHLDQTLAWTQTQLAEWYGAPMRELDEDRHMVAESVLTILEGDAAQRALYAWHMGWAPAQEASGKDWLAPFVALTLNDTYDVVRYIGGRSLKTLPGLEGFRYDFIGGDAHYRGAMKKATRVWKGQQGVARRTTGPQILISDNGSLMAGEVERRLKRRKDPPIILGE